VNPLLIVNPRSNNGATGRAFASMRPVIERALGPVDVATTCEPGDGIRLARQGAESGYDLIVAVGGDGTFHEVVNGVMQAKVASPATQPCKTQLGLIAQGTGGDFRKSVGLNHRLDSYLESIARGRTRMLDVGILHASGMSPSYFVNILSAGMGGLVDRFIPHTSRALGGSVAYFAASLKALMHANPSSIRCVVTRDGETTEQVIRSYMIAICNGRYFGGGMHIAPMATTDDGVFELVALGATSKSGLALTSPRIYSGTHMAMPSTTHLRGQRFELDFSLAHERGPDAFPLDIDGEVSCVQLLIIIEVAKHALELRV